MHSTSVLQTIVAESVDTETALRSIIKGARVVDVVEEVVLEDVDVVVVDVEVVVEFSEVDVVEEDVDVVDAADVVVELVDVDDVVVDEVVVG
jgi:formylmethanofuran dehydrogenase subunit A